MRATREPPLSPTERDEIASVLALGVLAIGALGGLVYGVAQALRWLAPLVRR